MNYINIHYIYRYYIYIYYIIYIILYIMCVITNNTIIICSHHGPPLRLPWTSLTGHRGPDWSGVYCEATAMALG